MSEEPHSTTVKIGRINCLRVVKELDFGLYLDGGELGEILLPRRYVSEGTEVDDQLEVFIYLDSEDRLLATTETPHAMAGELAYLRVAATTATGAFLDWGLPKDLLVPFREQRERLVQNEHYIVYVYFDTVSERMVASTKVFKFLKPPVYDTGEAVELIICNRFDLGYKVIIDKAQIGAIYHTEIFQRLLPGLRLKGYIKQIRPDGKIDVSLQKPGSFDSDDLGEKILQRLRAEGGFLAITDQSPPETIQSLFQVSKRAYKKAVGGLYKKRAISIEDQGIRLLKQPLQ